MTGDQDTGALDHEVDQARQTLSTASARRELPLATPELVSQWISFLQQDARDNGGTATVLLSDGKGGLVKLVACSQVVITEHIDGFIEVAVELRRFMEEVE